MLVAAGGAVGLYIRKESSDAEPKYRTERVDRGPVAATVTATGTISAVTTVQVGSQVSGIISHLYVDFNSPVKKGQLLAELDPTPLQAQVEQRRADLTQAQVQMRSAEIQFNRTKKLLDDGLTAAADYDTAKAAFDGTQAQVEQSQAALRQSETNLSYAKIYSPIDGVVVARQYDIGQTVAASFQAPTLFTIAEDLTKMQVQADVDQSDIGRIAVGQSARFTVDAYPDQTFKGTISQIRLNATQNQNVITYPVIIDVPNPDGTLKPKMTADVTIEVARVEDVLRIPNAALRFRPIDTSGSAATERAAGGGPPAQGERAGGRRPGGGFARAADALPKSPDAAKREQTVYLLSASGKLSPVGIKTGISDGRFTAVSSGELKPGDAVVVGIATARSEQTGGGLPGMGGGPRGGGGRRF